MNAYELADKAEQLKTGEYGYVDGWMDEAADMLRQQADRIAELEKDLLKYDRLAWDDLNKQGSEPYCWRMKANDPNDKDWWLFGRNPNRDEKVSHSAIPLYTTPQINERCEPLCKPSVCNCTKKELSDIEITEMFYHPDNRYDDTGLNYIAFARAILKKASEK